MCGRDGRHGERSTPGSLMISVVSVTLVYNVKTNDILTDRVGFRQEAQAIFRVYYIM